MPLLDAPAINQSFHFLAGNRPLLPIAIWGMVVAGFAEETVFRGYMFERFTKFFGERVAAKTAVIIITSIWFGLSHYGNQGIPGVQQATIFGFLFGAIYARRGSIFMLMVAHTAFDLTALALIYWNLEADVAKWIIN